MQDQIKLQPTKGGWICIQNRVARDLDHDHEADIGLRFQWGGNYITLLILYTLCMFPQSLNTCTFTIRISSPGKVLLKLKNLKFLQDKTTSALHTYYCDKINMQCCWWKKSKNKNVVKNEINT